MSDFVCCLTSSTIQPTPLLEKIRVAGLAGYQAIEPWNDEIDDYLKQGGTISDLRNALVDAGLKVVSVIALHSWITSDGPAHTAFSTNAGGEWIRPYSLAAHTSSPAPRKKSLTSTAPARGSRS